MAAYPNNGPVVLVLDADGDVRSGIQALLRTVRIEPRLFECVSDFRKATLPDAPSCLICDISLPEGDGLDLQDELRRGGSRLPIIFIAGYGTIQMAVSAMKAGASDFLTKPFRDQDLLDSVYAALALDQQRREAVAKLAVLRARVASLSPRQRSVFHMVVDGRSTGEIAHELQVHRSSVREFRRKVRIKLEARTIRDLVRIDGAVFGQPVEGESHASQF